MYALTVYHHYLLAVTSLCVAKLIRMIDFHYGNVYPPLVSFQNFPHPAAVLLEIAVFKELYM